MDGWEGGEGRQAEEELREAEERRASDMLEMERLSKDKERQKCRIIIVKNITFLLVQIAHYCIKRVSYFKHSQKLQISLKHL